MNKFPRYYFEVKRCVRDNRTYRMIIPLILSSRWIYREKGFLGLAKFLEGIKDDRAERIKFCGKAILTDCDNWRYAFHDLEGAIELAQKFHEKFEVQPND